MSSGGFVWVLLAKQPRGDTYVVNVYGDEERADKAKERWLAHHVGTATIERYTVF